MDDRIRRVLTHRAEAVVEPDDAWETQRARLRATGPLGQGKGGKSSRKVWSTLEVAAAILLFTSLTGALLFASGRGKGPAGGEKPADPPTQSGQRLNALSPLGVRFTPTTETAKVSAEQAGAAALQFLQATERSAPSPVPELGRYSNDHMDYEGQPIARDRLVWRVRVDGLAPRTTAGTGATSLWLLVDSDKGIVVAALTPVPNAPVELSGDRIALDAVRAAMEADNLSPYPDRVGSNDCPIARGGPMSSDRNAIFIQSKCSVTIETAGSDRLVHLIQSWDAKDFREVHSADSGVLSNVHEFRVSSSGLVIAQRVYGDFPPQLVK